jgi:ParB family chromosome partitioning protein
MQETSEGLTVKLVVISTIFIAGTRRSLSMDVVLDLGDSILREGLLHPITITESGRLVSGLHRLAAFKMLGREQIPCVIVPDDDLQNEFAEINENLVRNPLTVLERCELYRRMKELLAIESTKSRTEGKDFPKGYSQAIADRIKRTKRHVNLYIEIATLVDSAVKILIAPTQIADSLTDLRILKRVLPGEQKQLVELVLSGQAKSVSHAWRLMNRPARIEVAKEELKQLVAVLELFAQGPSWSELSPEEVNPILERFANANNLIYQSLIALHSLLLPPDKQTKKSSTSPHRRGAERESDNSVNQPLLPGAARIAGS